MNLDQRDSGGAKWGENVKRCNFVNTEVTSQLMILVVLSLTILYANMCSFLKGRSFPGTVKLSRKDKTPPASSQAGSMDSADATEAFAKSRSPSQDSLGVPTSLQVRRQQAPTFAMSAHCGLAGLSV